MFLCEMAGAKQYFRKYIDFKCSKLLYSKVSNGLLQQDLQNSYSFDKIQNVRGPGLSEEKI